MPIKGSQHTQAQITSTPYIYIYIYIYLYLRISINFLIIHIHFIMTVGIRNVDTPGLNAFKTFSAKAFFPLATVTCNQQTPQGDLERVYHHEVHYKDYCPQLLEVC